MQQAARISDKTAFFLNGEVVEFDDTNNIFLLQLINGQKIILQVDLDKNNLKYRRLYLK